MLSLPWRLRGSIAVDSPLTDAQIMEVLADWLDDQGKGVPDRDGKALSFSDPFWYIGGYQSVISLFDRGRFEVRHALDGRRLSYELRSLHAAMHLALVLAAMLSLLSVFDSGISRIEVIVMVAALYTGQRLFAIWRVPMVIRNAIGSA